MENYKEGLIFGFNESYIFNSEVVNGRKNYSQRKIFTIFVSLECVNLTVAVNATDFSSAAFLSAKNKTVNFSALVSASLKFSVKTVNLKSAGPISPPDCYRFDIRVC